MQEWFNWHAWKVCVPLKGTEGSNPSLSAKQTKPRRVIFIGLSVASLLAKAMDSKNERHGVPALFGLSPPPGINGANPSLSAKQTKPRRVIFIGQSDASLLAKAMDNKNERHGVPALFGLSHPPRDQRS